MNISLLCGIMSPTKKLHHAVYQLYYHCDHTHITSVLHKNNCLLLTGWLDNTIHKNTLHFYVASSDRELEIFNP